MSCNFKMFLNPATFAVMFYLILRNAHSNGEESLGIECPVIVAIHNIGKKVSLAQMEVSPDSNIVLSPLSIGALLNLFYLGTSGDTKTEIKNAFGYPKDLEESSIHEKYKKVLNSLKLEEKGVKVCFKTRLFLQKDFTILDSFKTISETSYLSEVENLDFKSSPEGAKERINAWVSESTEGKIDEIISGQLSPDTKLFAVNTVFFNATWIFPFNPSSTVDGMFFTGKENISIPMMNGDMTAPYLLDKELGLEMISLPYNGDRFCMLILKPLDVQDGNYFKKIYSILETNDLRTLIKKMETDSRLVASIPKMKIDSEIILTESLKSIGINKLFTTDADFGGLSAETGITVSDIVHKAIIEITEAGTIAAAVTSAPESKMGISIFFKLNSPSLLIIRDMKWGINLFCAKVFKPEPLK